MEGLLQFFECKGPVNEFDCHRKALIICYDRLSIVIGLIVTEVNVVGNVVVDIIMVRVEVW